MMNNTEIICTSVDATISIDAGASDDAITGNAVLSAASKAETLQFLHLDQMRPHIYKAIAAAHDDNFTKQMNELLRLLECAIVEEFNIAQESPSMCRKLARYIASLSNMIHSMITRHKGDSSFLSLYRRRMCYIVANYIACELCAAQQRLEKEQCILERISSMLSLYVEFNHPIFGVQVDMLRTLVAIPKLFGQTGIITIIYRRLFPQWSDTSKVISQSELSDKIYIEYIIIFYNWYRMESNDATKQRILEFASKFMRPSRTLPYNATYKDNLPRYNDSSTATRYILEHFSMKKCCIALRTASKLDNRISQAAELIIDSDEEEATDALAATVIRVLSNTPTTNELTLITPEPPDFLKPLCRNASRLQPVKRATALLRGIDDTREVIDLCESDDDDVEMFSLDFNVAANVDGHSLNELSVNTDDESVPITRIYPSNLRTYQRPTSSVASLAAPTTVIDTYTMPRIVNSYSCRRDSLHLVSTTQLVDQCVQTSENDEQHLQELEVELEDNHAIIYPDLTASTTTTELIYEEPFTQRSDSQISIPIRYNHNQYCHQPSSLNSHSSGASLRKKQVTFSADHLGACNPQYNKSFKSIKPSIKLNNHLNNTLKTSSKSTASNHVESLKKLGRKEHLLASQRMFSKLEPKKNCDKIVVDALSSYSHHKRKAADRQFHSSTVATTPTTSNASSGTPTPQPKRHQARGPQRALPTPPASTHSSIDTSRRLKSIDSVQSSVDISLVRTVSKNYKFNRRKFTDNSIESVSFYNNLLKLQRNKLRLRRKSGKEQNQSLDQLQINQLHSANIELRKNIEKLETDMADIINFAAEEQEKAAFLADNATLSPIVRLKRLRIEDLEKLAGRVGDIAEENVNPHQPVKRNLKRRRRRRKGPQWVRVKNLKKKMLNKVTSEPSESIESATETAKPAPTSIPACPALPLPAADLPPVATTAPMQTESDLCIAAYVTLAANGECYDEQDAVIKQITQLPTPSPETEQNSVLAAHEIEVATSNVPVYLLNGESRDVTTPLPAMFDSELILPET